MKRKCLLMTILLILGIPFSAFSGATLRSDGHITSRESDGSLIIDGQGYLVSNAVQVQDGAGKSIHLSSLKLPAQVRFEYRHTPRGPVILRIKAGSAVPE